MTHQSMYRPVGVLLQRLADPPVILRGCQFADHPLHTSVGDPSRADSQQLGPSPLQCRRSVQLFQHGFCYHNPICMHMNAQLELLCKLAGMFVTEELGAVSRTVFESARTLFVWLGDLLLYYTPLGFGRLGEVSAR